MEAQPVNRVAKTIVFSVNRSMGFQLLFTNAIVHRTKCPVKTIGAPHDKTIKDAKLETGIIVPLKSCACNRSGARAGISTIVERQGPGAVFSRLGRRQTRTPGPAIGRQ